MMFQFLSGRRPPNASTSSNSPEELEAAWAYEEAGHEHTGRNTGRYSDQAHQVPALSQTGSCCVEKACAVFHKAQDLLVVTTGDNDEIDSELYAQRDEALKRVRGLAGRTKNAVQAKKRVLDVMRDWLSADAPEVATFAFEVATEAVALLDSDPGQACSCPNTSSENRLDQTPTSERRNPFSWFARPRDQKTDTPFAN